MWRGQTRVNIPCLLKNVRHRRLIKSVLSNEVCTLTVVQAIALTHTACLHYYRKSNETC
jgi:hypothetical protein